MANELGEAGISGVLGLLNSGINAMFATRENKKNRNWQEKMYNLSVENNRQDAETAHGRQLELLQAGRENQLQYQKKAPSAQLQGLKDAGINLALGLNGGAAGGQGVGSTSAAQAAPAAYGNPTTFLPQMLDLSAVMKNFAEAGLAKAKSKTEEGLTEKIQDERKAIQQGIAESQERINKIKSECKLNDSQINLNNINADWQTIQNRIASATEETQIEIKKQELENLKQNFKKGIEEITSLQIENKHKEELLKAQIQDFWMNARKAFYEAAWQKMQNGRDIKKFNEEFKILQNTANKLMYEAENEKDFKDRWEKEMRQRKWEMWVGAGSRVLSQLIDVISSAMIPTKGANKVIKEVLDPTEFYGIE